MGRGFNNKTANPSEPSCSQLNSVNADEDVDDDEKLLLNKLENSPVSLCS